MFCGEIMELTEDQKNWIRNLVQNKMVELWRDPGVVKGTAGYAWFLELKEIFTMFGGICYIEAADDPLQRGMWDYPS